MYGLDNYSIEELEDMKYEIQLKMSDFIRSLKPSHKDLTPMQMPLLPNGPTYSNVFPGVHKEYRDMQDKVREIDFEIDLREYKDDVNDVPDPMMGERKHIKTYESFVNEFLGTALAVVSAITILYSLFLILSRNGFTKSILMEFIKKTKEGDIRVEDNEDKIKIYTKTPIPNDTMHGQPYNSMFGTETISGMFKKNYYPVEIEIDKNTKIMKIQNLNGVGGWYQSPMPLNKREIHLSDKEYDIIYDKINSYLNK